MVQTLESKALLGRDLAWFQRLGAAWSPKSAAKEESEPRVGFSFDFADVLEKGQGPGLTATFIDPPNKKAGEQRLTVECVQNRDCFILSAASGETLLRAEGAKDGVGYDIFVVRDGDSPKAQEPAFELRCNGAKDQWSLTCVRCEQCEARGKRQCGSRELARMFHYQEAVGDGQAFCMDLELPEIKEDGTFDVICSVCNSGEMGKTFLTTRRPKWNPRQKSLTLDFYGRCNLASAKNFQLEAEGEPDRTKLLFGKVGASKYVLDYQEMLGTVQAFAATVSAMHWK